ncbi:uncharacterized protein EV422DRAFT_263826 [Fimicolochytrium jonesii]|uniref:uncharacterized protein n=1 Tax=Fimicolochytrium jonesii TaxID=1396493 RepID=UPI0022FE93B1|nr:uncharacterized protein EV422DRAFT_263826 [Fimicolochytrium jonesii]KAI8817067.1 hypothetical protein EV422DRAFT_263826 [Fimicolochytrium jonesii]
MATGTVVKVAGVSSLVTEDVLKPLFEFLGQVNEVKLYPSPSNDGLQECQVAFEDPTAAQSALHLTGTDLGDRTLFVTITGKATPSLGATITASPAIRTPTVAEALLARNPNINASILQFDPVKAEEIARTVYIGNLSITTTEEELRALFAPCGEIAHVKMAGDSSGQLTRFAFMEFATQEAAAKALPLNGAGLGDRLIKVNYSKNAINKAPKKPDVMLDPAMRRVAEAQAAIAKKYGNEDEGASATTPVPSEVAPVSRRRRSRSRSVDTRWRRDRDLSRDRRRRRRSRSRSRSYDRRRHSRSRSRSRDRGSYRRRRSRSRSRERYRRDDERRYRNRSRERDRERDRDRDRDRDIDRDRSRDVDKVREKDDRTKVKSRREDRARSRTATPEHHSHDEGEQSDQRSDARELLTNRRKRDAVDTARQLTRNEGPNDARDEKHTSIKAEGSKGDEKHGTTHSGEEEDEEEDYAHKRKRVRSSDLIVSTEP